MRRALGDAIADVRIDMEPQPVPAARLAQPTPVEGIGAVDEEAEYREFAALFGLGDNYEQPPMRMVTMPQAEYDALKAESDKLPELMRERARPIGWSDEDERLYRRWALDMGLD